MVPDESVNTMEWAVSKVWTQAKIVDQIWLFWKGKQKVLVYQIWPTDITSTTVKMTHLGGHLYVQVDMKN